MLTGATTRLDRLSFEVSNRLANADKHRAPNQGVTNVQLGYLRQSGHKRGAADFCCAIDRA